MKILYISYWGINDVLTKATVFPNLNILKPYFSQVFLATIERTYIKEKDLHLPTGIIHIPYYSKRGLPRIIEKALDFVFFYFKLSWLAKTEKIDLIICRGSMAAAFGFFLNRTFAKPFIVESFEPHADYMAEGYTWKKDGIEYKLQKWFEAKSMKYARYLLPVTENYAKVLAGNGVPLEKIIVMPCCVDIEKFRFREDVRKSVRKNLALPDDVVTGIYVGKFGDIYLKKEAFEIFRKTLEVFEGKFFLIILTPQLKVDIQRQLVDAGFGLNRTHIDYVDHHQVPDYLSASDFAFSLIRPSVSRKFCSPIKNGEYWANGLPVLLTNGIGDDEQIIIKNCAGAILNMTDNNIESSLNEIKLMLKEGRSAISKRIMPLAEHYRNFEIVANGYSTILGKAVTKGRKN